MAVRLKFHGAARTVTGSCYLIETEQARLLVDCGMFQGSKTERELNYRPFPFEPSSLTAVLLPAGHDADKFREVVLEHFDMSLGTGLAKLKGKVFRIGHLGDFNDLTLAGTLSGVEMGLELAGVPHKKGGVLAALEYLTSQARNAGSVRAAA